MKLIGREELKKKLDNKEEFKLVMVLGEWQFKAKHIPGSINIPGAKDAVKYLKKEDEIVVYCSGIPCLTSKMAYQLLEEHGYKNVRCYAGGIADWEEAGYPLEGEWVS